MHAKEISFQTFRNIQLQTIALDAGVNVLCGQNAQGKTNALEGIYLFAQGRSFRTAREREYIAHNAQFCRLTLAYHADGRDQRSELCYLKNGRKGVKRNGVTLHKLSEFIGSFRAVMFCPEHLSLIKEGPALRRRFLDSAISQLDSRYLRAVQEYQKILAQRNRLLSSYPREEATVRDTLGLWDEQLAAAGELICTRRAEYTEQAQASAVQFFADMTDGGETPEFRYKEPRTKAELLAELAAHREKDLKFGTTNAGVHKDDIAVTLNGRDARAYASQGQQRSLALALKLAEASISEQRTGERPVLLLDDVLSELDDRRRQFVLTGITGGQVIITACEPELFHKVGGKIITVKNGVYQ